MHVGFVTPVITAASILNSIPATWLQLPESPAGQEQYALKTSPPGHSSASFCIIAQTSYDLEETRYEGTHLVFIMQYLEKLDIGFINISLTNSSVKYLYAFPSLFSHFNRCIKSDESTKFSKNFDMSMIYTDGHVRIPSFSPIQLFFFILRGLGNVVLPMISLLLYSARFLLSISCCSKSIGAPS